METERSIVLQKKMILFLSLMIAAVLGVVYGREFSFKNKKAYANEVENLNLVTVNVSDDENEILRKSVKYLATKTIVEDSELEQVKNEKIEAFAGDVTSLVDLNLIETSENEENVIVANNSESINEVISEVEENEILNNVNEEISTEAEDPIAEVAVIDTELVQSVEISVDQSNTKTVRYRELAENDPPTEYVNVVEATATAYCLCKKCCGKTPDNPYYGYTHSGIKIEPGTGMKVIAVDPSVIPLNSKVYVEGLNGAWDYGHAIAADTGSAIKELKIDLYMDTHEEALEWGRRKVKVYVLGE